MLKNTPIDNAIVSRLIKESGLECLGTATIREIVRLVNRIEEETGEKFIRMEMGVPGLEVAPVGIAGEKKALDRGVASKYPMIEGVKELKEEISRFVKLFVNIDVDPEGCIPTVGTMMGSMAAFLVANRNDHTREGTLFIDPGFPVQKQQVKLLGHDYCSFDVYNFRGKKLKQKLESYLKTGKVSTIMYSNPNNPTWICFTEEELEIIGTLASKYDVIVLEDLAYFAMDFRKDMSKPGIPPYQASVANYTDNYLLFISSSKAFSYAGQRIGMMIISDKLFNRSYPDLKRYHKTDKFGYSMIYGALYALSAGVQHSAQWGLRDILKEANEGRFNFVEGVKEYASRAKIMKKMFTENGFRIVYDRDVDKPLADGFYFTLSYPGFTGAELLENLLYYGISAISLEITGSDRKEGIRACVSQTGTDRLKDLEHRLKCFDRDHGTSRD